MKRCLVLFSAVACLAAEPAKEGKARKDQDRLQGTWVFASLEANGRKSADDDLRNSELVIKGTAMKPVPDNPDLKISFKLDPSTDPRLIDITVNERVLEGIYKFDGDDVKICLYTAEGVKQRPTEFAAPEGSNNLLVVLKRVKE